MKSDLYSNQDPKAPQTLDYATSSEDGPVLGRPTRPPPATWLRVLVSLVLIIAVVGVAAGGFIILVSTRPTAVKSQTQILPPLVEIVAVNPQDVREEYLGYGTARAEKEVKISTELAGRVVNVPDAIEDGVAIAKGDVIIEIDRRDYENSLERARAQLADVNARLETLDVEESNTRQLIEISERELKVNEDEYQRLRNLYEQGNASKKELDFSRLAAEASRRNLQTLKNTVALIPARKAELVATKNSREVEIDKAELDLTKTIIRSPLSGQVDRILVESGDYLMPGMQIATIIDTDLIEVPIELPLSVRSKVHVGAPVILAMDSTVGDRWEAKVVRLAPAADQSSRTFIAYLEVDNREQESPLVPGSFVTASVEGKLIRDALIVPRGVIVGHDVFVSNNKRVERKNVKIESLIGDRAVVSGDLQPGDYVITTNLDVLFAGERVRIAGEEENGESDVVEEPQI